MVAVSGCLCCCWTLSRNLIVFSLVWNFGRWWPRCLGCRSLGSRTDPRAASRQKASMTTRGRKAPLKYPGWWPCSNCNSLWLSPWLQCIVYRELCVTMLQFWGRQRLFLRLFFFASFFFTLFFKTGMWDSQTVGKMVQSITQKSNGNDRRGIWMVYRQLVGVEPSWVVVCSPPCRPPPPPRGNCGGHSSRSMGQVCVCPDAACLPSGPCCTCKHRRVMGSSLHAEGKSRSAGCVFARVGVRSCLCVCLLVFRRFSSRGALCIIVIWTWSGFIYFVVVVVAVVC